MSHPGMHCVETQCLVQEGLQFFKPDISIIFFVHRKKMSYQLYKKNVIILETNVTPKKVVPAMQCFGAVLNFHSTCIFISDLAILYFILFYVWISLFN